MPEKGKGKDSTSTSSAMDVSTGSHAPMACCNCGGKGHMSKNCTSPSQKVTKGVYQVKTPSEQVQANALETGEQADLLALRLGIGTTVVKYGGRVSKDHNPLPRVERRINPRVYLSEVRAVARLEPQNPLSHRYGEKPGDLLGG